MDEPRGREVSRLVTGIPGFDPLGGGGLPAGRTTLVVGGTGSGKTVFAGQFLAEGVRRGDPGVFVTLEESAQKVRRNLASFGWDIDGWERAGLWRFVDASPSAEHEVVIGEGYDLSGLLSRTEAAVREIEARRVAIDSLAALFSQYPARAAIRRETVRLTRALEALGVTCVVTNERPGDGQVSTEYSVEEFVADSVVVLRNGLMEAARHRTVEILKMRGASHRQGEASLAIRPMQGMVVIPMSGIEMPEASTTERVSAGDAELDGMLGGGFLRGSTTLVAGATGTGKTLALVTFVAGGLSAGERCLVYDFEESRAQLVRNAAGWGVDLEDAERRGLLRIRAAYPETVPLEEHLARLRDDLADFEPARLGVDSLTALERITSDRAYREFVVSLLSSVKGGVTTLMTSSTPVLATLGPTAAHISNTTDTIVMLYHVEMYGELSRALVVLKMRGSAHDRAVREFTIDRAGLHVGRPIRAIGGILADRPVHVGASEVEHLRELFGDTGGGAA